MSVFFITGVDSHIGKTYATGYLAKQLMNHGVNIITQKLVQTGCDESIATDIAVHRKIMQMTWQWVDKTQVSCPFVFASQGSPHLASTLEDVTINLARLAVATKQSLLKHEMVLVEIDGGVMTPLSDSVLTIDYMAMQGNPVILVTSGLPDSINQTLLVIEALAQRELPVHALIYNQWHDNLIETNEANKELLHDEALYEQAFDDHDKAIKTAKCTRTFLQNYLKNNHPDTYWVEMPRIDSYGLDPLYTQWQGENRHKDMSYNIDGYAEQIADTVLYNGKPFR